MKTSTKMLIVFFACIPLSLLAYNILLSREFVRGEFVQHVSFSQPNRTWTSLPAFKHIVVNGNLVLEDELSTVKGKPMPSSGTVISWMPKIGFEYKELDGKAGMDVMKIYEDYVGYIVRNDTLYISFRSDDRNGPDFRYDPSNLQLVKIYSGQLQSITCVNGNYTISGKGDADSLTVNGSGDFSNYRFKNLNLKHLLLNLRDSTKATIEDNSLLQEVSYSLEDKSHLSIQSLSKSVGQLNHGKADSATVISLTGRAQEMKKYLP